MRVTMKRIVMLTCFSTLLAGCAQRWAKPGGTPEEFRATEAQCQARAFSQFPPVMDRVQTSPGYTTPLQTSCYPSGYAVQCLTTGGQYMPPTFMSIDRNDSVRARGVQGCLLEQGWRPVDREGRPQQIQ